MILRTLSRGDRRPRGWGVAWVRFDQDRAVIAPLGLNVVLAQARRVWLWVVRGGLPLPESAGEAFAAGVRHGLGLAAGWVPGPED